MSSPHDEWVLRATREYWTREQLRHRLPAGIPLEPIWAEVERARASSAQTLPLLLDDRGRAYRFSMTPRMLASIHNVDRLGASALCLVVYGHEAPQFSRAISAISSRKRVGPQGQTVGFAGQRLKRSRQRRSPARAQRGAARLRVARATR